MGEDGRQTKLSTMYLSHLYPCTTLNSGPLLSLRRSLFHQKSFRLPQCECVAIAIPSAQIDGNRERGIYIYHFIGYKNLFEFYSRIEIKSVSTNATNAPNGSIGWFGWDCGALHESNDGEGCGRGAWGR